MSSLTKVLGITALAGIGGTGLGGALACLFRRDSHRSVSLLLSFAAGVMTGVVCFDLLTDALHPESPERQTAVWIVVLGVLAGYAGIGLLNAGIARLDARIARRERSLGRPTDRQRSGRQNNLLLAGLVMAAAIALHNAPEGMVIGASFAKSADRELLSRSGMMMAIVIGLHNIPEGMAVSVPLLAGGLPKRRAVALAAITGAPTVPGALLGYCLGTLGPLALALCLSFASGAMLYVVFGELLPEALAEQPSKLPALAVVAGMMTGLLIVFA